ncbi:DUF1684 domain-containing protein [Urechidicola croceus]|uniref:DUF1684 domain-containing protein n=1 Tax=Urechidicola croceus TaxID=1850246 RepID=A0A1D8P767_9FLAO|nr:DUF1684 domain-containing protein [Urechidicola croceus]AOW20396.1 hypothetical protein LPB138_06790 [Urechidicola croceus]
MKNLITLFLLSLFISSCAQEKKFTHIEEIEHFQYKLNVEYSDKKTTPLKDKDFKKFKNLEFFPINSSYKIVADFISTPNEPIFEMPTTTDRKPLYTQYGIATFLLDNKEFTLRIYQNQKLMIDPEYEDYLFIPFTDLTNGNETYDAGRYIDIRFEDIKNGKITFDFNKAYNPYCAYNDKYSCPIPPKENDLAVEIKAGVLAFHKN